MTTDKTPATLATAKPGGCVQLGKIHVRESLLRHLVRELNHARRGFDSAVRADYVHRCLLSVLDASDAQQPAAQPSPGGQGDALSARAVEMLRDDARLVGVIADNIERGKLDHPGFYRNTQLAEVLRRVLSAALAARQPVERSFQAGVAEWMGQCFLPSLYSNMTERGDRLLEEVLELLQAHGYDKARVPTLVDYVFSRPVGDPAQEVGGVMVTLAGYCWVAGLDMHVHGHAELARISHPEVMAKIRAKQEAKNALHFDTPLPGNAVPPAQAVDLPYSLDADPAGIRARVADCITGTLMVGAQGHTPPPAAHWAEPFWQAARADAGLQVKMREALWAAAKSLRTIADSTKDTEFLETASEIRAYANSRANCAEQALTDSQAVGNGR